MDRWTYSRWRFAGIIFGEKLWSRGIWVARAAGMGLAIAGLITALGIVDISGHDAMVDQEMPATSPVQEQMGDGTNLQEDQVSDGGISIPDT